MALVTFIRYETDSQFFKDSYWIAFAVLTLLGINFGAMVLCFRRKKFVYLMFLTEIAYLILFSIQIYEMIGKELPESDITDSDRMQDTVYYTVTHGQLKIHFLISVGLVLFRIVMYIAQILIICFRLKY